MASGIAMKLVNEETYLRDPSGTMVRGRQWLHGTIDRGRRFSVLFGNVDATDMAGLLHIWIVDMANGSHTSLFDGSGLTGVTFEAFSALSDFLRDHRPWLSANVLKQALVHPSGFVGAVVAGYYRVFSPPCPYYVCATRSDAATWLGYPPEALTAIDAQMQLDPLVMSLRHHLEQDPSPSLDAVARALHVSSRTLQRRLLTTGTSFSSELTRAQLNRAMFLLRTSDDKLATIAAKVGCRSLASFSEMFLREIGVRPSEWRAQHKR